MNVANFKSLSLETDIIIELNSMDDLSDLNMVKEYFPEHSELTISLYDRKIKDTNFDKPLLLDILLKFKLTSLYVENGNKNKDIFMQLLQMSEIQETLKHFTIYNLDVFKCTSVIALLIECKRIKTIKIGCFSDADGQELTKWKQEIRQFEENLRNLNPEIQIDIDYI